MARPSRARAAAAAALLLAGGASATGSRARTPSREELLATLQHTVPDGVDPAFECAWRKLAFEYAQTLRPLTAPQLAVVHDGLQLTTLCNVSFGGALPAPEPAAPRPDVAARLAAAATTLYVDPVGGNDDNPGTQGAPLKTVAAGVARARGAPQPAAVLLRATGVHRLTETLTLGAADSGLTIAAFPGEAPVVSGGAVITPANWAPYNVSSSADAGPDPSGFVVADRQNNMFGQWPSPVITNASSAPSAAGCEALAVAANVSGFIWYDPAQYGNPWGGFCFLRHDAVWGPTAQAGVTSGYRPPPPAPRNVWVADISGSPLPAWVTADPSWAVTLLTSADGGATPVRAIRGRYPNADPELDRFPKGWQAGGKRLTPPPGIGAKLINVTLTDNYGPSMFRDYVWGEGGPCDRLGETNGADAGSYWCQPFGRVANQTYMVRTPLGIIAPPGMLPNAPYASGPEAHGGTVHWWRSGHWFSLMARLNGSAVQPDGSTALTWSYGGFQGAEGDSNGEDWFVEHVREEVDAPREFYLDVPAGKLYYAHNATPGTPPPAGWTWEVPLLQVLINVTGSEAAPAADIAISGITFTGAAATFLAPHGIPSGGDWAMARRGALTAGGSVRLAVTDCVFTRLDGNALMLNGYNRNVTVDSNEFVWLGESALASWGFTDGVDGTAGQQPWGTVFSRNLCHEIGVYEKQVSCYSGALSALATIDRNIMFNMPRAAVNINDGMGGGTVVSRNVMWATCTESQDHSAFNSWDRVPYYTTVLNGTKSLVPAYNEGFGNFIVAGGGANGGAFDNDDGSSFYLIHDNFHIYGGHKSDFDGHAKRSYNNVALYSYVYGDHCASIMNLPHPIDGGFYAEGYWNNTCVLSNAGDPYLSLGSGCSPTDPDLKLSMILGGNRVFAPNASVTVSCGKSMSFAEWAAYGQDAGSTVGDVPSVDVMMGWGRAVLGLPPAAAA